MVSQGGGSIGVDRVDGWFHLPGKLKWLRLSALNIRLITLT